MKPEKVFKRYDVRGRYPEELDETFVERMGESLGSFINQNYNGKVVVCKDTKGSSEDLKTKLIKGLRSQGITVFDIGVGPTDMAAFHSSEMNCVGVQVTSSHMPLEFNGLKFIYPEGNGFINEDLNKLKEIFRKNDFEQKNKGDLEPVESSAKKYKNKLEEFVKENIGTSEQRKVVIETMGGAGASYLPEVLDRLGFEVVNINTTKTPYRNPPNPSPDNLIELKDKVESENAFIGLALDMDADRVAAYFNGDWISGDDLFCVFAQLFEGETVASVDTDTKIERFSENVFYTRVGDPFVISETIERGAALSGEPNGHYCFPKFVNYNSGILSSLILASCDLEKLLEAVPESIVAENSIDFDARSDTNKAMQEFKSYSKRNFDVISDIDGVKFNLDDYTLLVRPSGSSPKIRVKGFGQNEGVNDAVEQVLTILQKNKDIN